MEKDTTPPLTLFNTRLGTALASLESKPLAFNLDRLNSAMKRRSKLSLGLRENSGDLA